MPEKAIGERPRRGLRGAGTRLCDGAAAHVASRPPACPRPAEARPPAPAWAGEAGAVRQHFVIPTSNRGPAAVVLHVSFDSLGRFVHVARSKRACVDVCRWQGPSGFL